MTNHCENALDSSPGQQLTPPNGVTPNREGPPHEVFYIQDLMRMFCASRSTIDRMRERGTLPPEMTSLGGRPRWRRRVVEQWFERNGSIAQQSSFRWSPERKRLSVGRDWR